MDIISQMQEQVNLIASLAFNTFGTLQRDAPPVRLSPNYPEPTPLNHNSQPPAQQPPSEPQQPPQATAPQEDFADEPKKASAALVKAAKQAENDVVGQELQRQLEAADEELKQVQEMFNQASDKCLNMKNPY
ncbi:mediator of RNA polymerase II transcription subunit 21-like isoform X2 [Silene latifolia]|uniref:mediator of RNA polymerase II transcription subunit 21-like isoform X2 n=1 Tax=Silene latifolia TaxID=37657 RepID=UPI003D76C31A